MPRRLVFVLALSLLLHVVAAFPRDIGDVYCQLDADCEDWEKCANVPNVPAPICITRFPHFETYYRRYKNIYI